jgi:hypothetical protein
LSQAAGTGIDLAFGRFGFWLGIDMAFGPCDVNIRTDGVCLSVLIRCVVSVVAIAPRLSVGLAVLSGISWWRARAHASLDSPLFLCLLLRR